MNVEDFTLIDQLKLMGYGESDSSGCWMKLQIHPEQLEILRGLKGEIFEVAMRQLDNACEPVKPQRPKGGRLSQDAGIWRACDDVCEFAQSLGYQNGKEMIYRECMPNYEHPSCAWLDHDPDAAEAYLDLKRRNNAFHRNKHEE